MTDIPLGSSPQSWHSYHFLISLSTDAISSGLLSSPIKFKRDIFKDLTKLEKSYKDKDDGTGEMEIEDLEIFENVAYIMALHADPSIPGDINDWLDQFEMFSIYEILPENLELWGSNIFTDISSKKN